jgi:dienelactone hydrolase
MVFLVKNAKIIKLLTLLILISKPLLFLNILVNSAEATVIVKTVEYRDGDTVLEGRVAFDDSVPGKRPGIVVIHEWTGLGKYVTSRIELLAKLGYVAFAADIYGKGIRPTDPQSAGKVAGSFKSNLPFLRKRTDLAVQELKKMKEVDPQNLAAMGYCFGGTSTLELARSGANLKGFISFHGGLSTPAPQDAKNIKGEVLVFTGADDPHVPPVEVLAFQKEMQDAHVSHWEVVTYGNAVHAFTNPDSGSDNAKGAAYNAEADHKSWEAMKLFLNRIFKTGKVSA